MAKKVTGFLKLQVPAGSANPSPPIGPALGQRGLNIMEFCKAFNAQTQNLEKNETVRITEGPFQTFTGIIDDVNEDKQEVSVMVTIFGRSTPVKLEFGQVEKA